MATESNNAKKVLNEVLVQVMRLQKQYAHEQLGARTDRRAEIKKIVNRAAAGLDKKNGN